MGKFFDQLIKRIKFKENEEEEKKKGGTRVDPILCRAKYVNVSDVHAHFVLEKQESYQNVGQVGAVM